MIPDFSKLDGTNRVPRAEQLQALDWIRDNWASSRILALDGPVAVGKSLIARAIQKATGAAIITPSNLLINQYVETYPKVNFLKGKTHYRCTSGLTCSEWIDGLEQKACLDCPYQESKKRAMAGQSTFFNPMSLYYLLQQTHQKMKVIVIDEAHQMPATLLKLCSKKFAKSEYKLPADCRNEVILSKWMGEQLGRLKRLVALYQNTDDHERVSRILGEIESIHLTKSGLDSSPELYAIWFSDELFRGRPDTFLNVQPIKPPASIVDKLLGSDKLILLSGTLLKSDIEEIAQSSPYEYLSLASPIPIENRPILYRPVHYPMKFDTPPGKIVDTVEQDLRDFPERNTIVHTTYARARQMHPHFKRPIMVNTASNKQEIVDRFKKEGGVFLASGCAEGIDLKGDICRLNIIPHFLRPNIMDPVVQKRRALPDGERWYNMQAMKLLIQQYGRSTRDVNDKSITIVHDPMFKRIVQAHDDEIPSYFKAAIKWNGNL